MYFTAWSPLKQTVFVLFLRQENDKIGLLLPGQLRQLTCDHDREILILYINNRAFKYYMYHL